MSTEPLRTVRDHLSEVIDRVEHQHERVVVTRNGHEAAVLISLAGLGGNELALTPPARRAISDRLPEAVAVAAVDPERGCHVYGSIMGSATRTYDTRSCTRST